MERRDKVRLLYAVIACAALALLAVPATVFLMRHPEPPAPAVTLTQAVPQSGSENGDEDEEGIVEALSRPLELLEQTVEIQVDLLGEIQQMLALQNRLLAETHALRTNSDVLVTEAQALNATADELERRTTELLEEARELNRKTAILDLPLITPPRPPVSP